MERLLTIKDVCQLLQISQALAYKWIHYDFIPHVKMGTLVRFKESTIIQWVKKKEKRGRSCIKLELDSML